MCANPIKVNLTCTPETKLFCSPLTGIKTKVVDVTKKEQVEALAKEHEHVDVLFNVAGYSLHLSCIIWPYPSFYCQEISWINEPDYCTGWQFFHYILMETVVYSILAHICIQICISVRSTAENSPLKKCNSPMTLIPHPSLNHHFILLPSGWRHCT